MTTINLSDKSIKRDPWVKTIKQSFEPDKIADLLFKRITEPSKHGPYAATAEQSTYLITALIDIDDKNRSKIVPGVGLLLYNLLHERISMSHELLRAVFLIIKASNLRECATLLYKWLEKNEGVLICDDVKWKSTYRDAMYAWAAVQPISTVVEQWWNKIWMSGTAFWQTVSFYGLCRQNPKYAVGELPRLMTLLDDAGAADIISTMWMDTNIKEPLRMAIARNIDKGTGWAGRALNCLLDKFTVDTKTAILLSMRDAIFEEPNITQ